MPPLQSDARGDYANANIDNCASSSHRSGSSSGSSRRNVGEIAEGIAASVVAWTLDIFRVFVAMALRRGRGGRFQPRYVSQGRAYVLELAAREVYTEHGERTI